MFSYKMIFSLLVIMLLFSSCNDSPKEKKQTENEIIMVNKNTTNSVDVLKNRMFAYQKEFHPSYSKEDVIVCGDILNLYLTEIESLPLKKRE